jgi:hypothetical protein
MPPLAEPPAERGARVQRWTLARRGKFFGPHDVLSDQDHRRTLVKVEPCGGDRSVAACKHNRGSMNAMRCPVVPQAERQP